jgi:hypothetical protein
VISASGAGGLQRSLGVRGHDEIRFEGTDQRSYFERLCLAGVVERWVCLTLEAVLRIPGRAPVPQQQRPALGDQAIAGHYAPSGAKSMVGQSFHNRSSA